MMRPMLFLLDTNSFQAPLNPSPLSLLLLMLKRLGLAWFTDFRRWNTDLLARGGSQSIAVFTTTPLFAEQDTEYTQVLGIGHTTICM